jgi:hypothetical protein
VVRGTPGNPAVGPDLEEIGMAPDESVLPRAACVISPHPPTPTQGLRQ